MRTWLKWTVRGVVALVAVAAAVAIAGTWLAEKKRTRQIEIKVLPVAIPTDAASIERGRYLYLSRGCTDCHGTNGAGRDFVNDGSMHLAGPNISPGPGNVVANYQLEDWVRTLRHGVKPNKQPVFIMPSEDYNRLTDADTGALIAYVKSLPPVAGGAAVVQLPLPVKVLYGLGAIPDPVEKIDHSLPPAKPVATGVTVEHGAYVANMCIGCHGAALSGGKIPGGPPDWPAAANLTPGEKGVLGNYKDAAQFAAMFKSGKRPDGSEIKVMPFESLREVNDTDVQALYAFLKTVPAKPFGQR